MKNLRAKRKAVNMTQVELAQVLAVTQSTIACWEAGTKYPSADKLPDIARVLHCKIDELYVENETIKEAV